jgi:conjugative relaxase-like TrwC/TraI family protein
MLSIKALKLGDERYYLALALEDYYLQGGEPPGIWLGTGAKILGLTGNVTNEQLSNLFRGYSPDRQMTALVQNAGHPDRQPGWDLTLNVPKTVSVLWSAASERIRAEIEAAETIALERTISYIEEHLARSRIGKGGTNDVPARLVVAAFPHTTSRALDPHLHYHPLIMNVGVGPDARTRTVLSFPFYQNKMLLGALFRAELAHELVERLGLALSRERTWFEVDGVPPALAREQSTRRREIEEELGRLGVETAAAATYATLKTRRVKEIVPNRDELFEKWRAVAQKHGLDDEAIKLLIGKNGPPRPEDVLPQATKQALKDLTNEHSHFSKLDLLRALAEAPASLGVSVDALCSHTNKTLAWSNDIICLGTRNGETRYTTRQMLKLEEKLLAAVHKLGTTTFHTLSDRTVNKVIQKERDFTAPPTVAKRFRSKTIKDAVKDAVCRFRPNQKTTTGKLTEEQACAVTHITQQPQRIALLSGYAGTAKTTTLQAVREAFEAEGYKVIGATLSGKAARELSNRAGIPSTTIRMRERELHPSLGHQLKQHARQLHRAGRRWKTSRPRRLVIDSKTVLVLDEASMIGTKDMNMLVRAVARGGGKLVLVGDKHQLPSIDAGGPFGSIAERIPPVHLRNVVRQADERDREAVKLMPEGEAKRALANYVEKNQVKLAETRTELFAKLISDWEHCGGATQPEKNIICAALNREVDDLNDLAQALRLKAGRIDPSQRISIRRKAGPYEPATKEMFCVGDRVTVTKKSKKHALENGDTGTIVGVSPTPLSKTISVLFDGEKTPRIVPLRSVPVRRGYAFTTHKLQGATADNVFVAITGPMLNRQMAYVQMSRHKHSLNLYAPQSLAEKDLRKTIERREMSKAPPPPIAPDTDLRSVLTSLMTKDAGKDLAHDVIRNQVPARPSHTLTRDEAERLLRGFAKREELEIAKDARKLHGQVVCGWQKAGGVTAPSEHKMFADSQSDRHTLNRIAQKAREDAGLLDCSRSFATTEATFLVGDHLRFESELRKFRVGAGTIARLVDVSAASIQVQCTDSNEPVTLPKHLVRASLAYALPTADMTVSMPKTAHVCLSDRFGDAELSHVYHSLHRESCRLYVNEATAGHNVRATVADSMPSKPPARLSPQPDITSHKRAPKQVIGHG